MGVEGGDQDQQVQGEAQGSNACLEKILVTVRLRPLNNKEIQSNDFADWDCVDSTTIVFKNGLSERSMYPNAYTFDRVFGFDSSTKQVYEEAAKEVALSVLNGINSSVFAYGQTSSGKTFTMAGITQYAVADICDYIDKHAERDFVLKFAAMEIYNEHVRDLLNADTAPLRLLDDPERGTVVEKLTEETVKDKSHLLELIAVCEAQRQVGETSINETSSRSHQILRLTIESSPRRLARGTRNVLVASVNFVDLAGSERTSQTSASGTRMKEGSHINRSLLTLGKCIRSLSKGRNGHIPYRDSKLTRILQNSLGGNARTAIICTMSPAHNHLEQSRNTLLFASCAKQVTTNARVNVVMSDKALVKHLRKELARLEKALSNMSLGASKGNVAAALKEKEEQIEQMDREMKELSRQRNVAHMRLEELLSSGIGTPSSQSQDGGSWPRTSESQRTLSWLDDSSLTSDASDYRRLEVNLAASEALKFLQENGGFDLICHRELLENFDDNLLPDEYSTQLLNLTTPVSTHSTGFQSPRWEDMTTLRRSKRGIEDNCKEVRCIEVQVPCTDRITELPDPMKISPQEAEKEDKKESFNEDETEKEKEKEKEQEKKNESSDVAEKKEEVVSQVDQADYDALVKRVKELQMTIDYLSRNANAEQPSSTSSESDGSNLSRLNFSRSRSCKAILTATTPFSPPAEMVAVHQWDQSLGGPNKVISPDRPKVTVANQDGNRKLSRLASLLSMKHHILDEMTDDVKCSENGIAEVEEEITEPKERSMAVVLSEPKENKSVEEEVNKIKDLVVVPQVRDCMPERALSTVESQMSWQEEFESQRSQIIELWHACHIPLVHRTYFFLLFKGDPSDKVYMDVELRRLAYIKNRFSEGQKNVLDGQTFIQSSSMRALNQERDMLVKQMYKRFPSQERESLFRRWGIDINSKQRRLQLARRLWTDPKDMQNIRESATLVARLIDFTDESQIPKEMFVGPSFTPKTLNRRSYSWR